MRLQSRVRGVRRVRRGSRVLGLAVAVVAVLPVASAFAGPPTGDYALFNHCPTGNPNVLQCVFSQTTSGTFKLGNAAVPINKTITLQGGVSYNYATSQFTWVNPTDGTPTLSPTALDVPGGLTGLMTPTQSWGIPLIAAFNAAVAAANGVTATAEVAGTLQYNFFAFTSGSGPALVLPIKVHLQNPFLGSSCYIGSTSSPVTLKLTTGTTSPPAGTAPISGTAGDLQFLDDGDVSVATGAKLVDNTFTVPGASGCGGIFSLLIDPVLDLKEGIPAAAGKSYADMRGNLRAASSAGVIASE